MTGETHRITHILLYMHSNTYTPPHTQTHTYIHLYILTHSYSHPPSVNHHVTLLLTQTFLCSSLPIQYVVEFLPLPFSQPHTLHHIQLFYSCHLVHYWSKSRKLRSWHCSASHHNSQMLLYVSVPDQGLIYQEAPFFQISNTDRYRGKLMPGFDFELMSSWDTWNNYTVRF